VSGFRVVVTDQEREPRPDRPGTRLSGDMSGHVGVIGLGVMGGTIARHLLEAGYTVTGYDIARERLDQHAARGGLAASSCREVADRAAMVLTSLPSAAALEQVVAGDQGLAAGDHPDLIVIEASTLPIEVKEHARELLARRGATLLDCPLSGTGAQARVKDLVVLASGDPEALRRCQPILATFARSWHDLGAFGNGSKLKFLANLLVTIHNLAAAEAILLAKRAGLDPGEALTVLTDGAGSSRMLEMRGPAMVTGSYEPAAMRVELYQKDIDLIAAFARDHRAPTPLFSTSAQYYLAALAQGRAAQDTACLLAVLEQLAGRGGGGETG
jgi:3-hydroxyisobutyrate dehydrogenase-like beta-hydroxyacid dehydrogenase